MDVTHADLADSFHINRLPDAGNRRVPAAHQPALPILLAAGLGAVRMIHNAEAEIVFALRQQRGHIQRERRIAADVGTGFFAVQIDVAGVIHSAEAEQNAPALHLLRNGERAAIPDDRVNLIRRTDAAHLRLIGKRNGDFHRQGKAGLHPFLGNAFIRVVKGKLPDAVEIKKRIAHKIGTWMLRTGNNGVHGRSSCILV